MPKKKKRQMIEGSAAILGMDIVSFSTLHDDDQMKVIENLLRWIREALNNYSLYDNDFVWSPSGDGGFLSFANTRGNRKAIDVGFTIFDKTLSPDWLPRTGKRILLRMALHMGSVKEGHELGRYSNIWGIGINTTARILTVCAPSQFLISKQYFDAFITGQREEEFEIGDTHWRTVKHGVQVEVLNINRNTICLSSGQAKAKQWRDIGELWKKVINEYTYLICDSMQSNDPIAAIAASTFLLDLDEKQAVHNLTKKLGACNDSDRTVGDYPPRVHRFFSQMPPELLFRVIENITPKIYNDGDVICDVGEVAMTSYFPVSGRMVVEVAGRKMEIENGSLVGEFSLWVPHLKRTAKIIMEQGGLVLEIRNDKFKEALNDNEHVQNAIYSIIKNRITENTLRSKIFFPLDENLFNESLAKIPLKCDKYKAGSKLNIEKTAYFLFSGTVEIKDGNQYLKLESTGEYTDDSVVGIIVPGKRKVGGVPVKKKVDGSTVTILKDSVMVSIDHDIIVTLQNTYSTIRGGWFGLWGKRCGKLSDLQEESSISEEGEIDSMTTTKTHVKGGKNMSTILELLTVSTLPATVKFLFDRLGNLTERLNKEQLKKIEKTKNEVSTLQQQEDVTTIQKIITDLLEIIPSDVTIDSRESFKSWVHGEITSDYPDLPSVGNLLYAILMRERDRESNERRRDVLLHMATGLNEDSNQLRNLTSTGDDSRDDRRNLHKRIIKSVDLLLKKNL